MRRKEFVMTKSQDWKEKFIQFKLEEFRTLYVDKKTDDWNRLKGIREQEPLSFIEEALNQIYTQAKAEQREEIESIKHEAELLGKYANYLKSLIPEGSNVSEFWRWVRQFDTTPSTSGIDATAIRETK